MRSSAWSSAWAVLFLVSGIRATAAAPTSAATVDLRSHRQPGDLTRIELTLEMAGQFRQPSGEEDQPVTRKVNVNGRLVYDEKLLTSPAGEDSPGLAARYYHEAGATYKLDDQTVQPKLRAERRLIGVKTQGSEAFLYSPNGTLVREEFDLINVPANTLLLDRLLPGKKVTAGDTWKHSDALMAALLGFDSVTTCEVESKLLGVDDGVARIQLGGRLEGKFGGAAKQVELKGKYQFDLSARRISWFGILLKESREVSEVASGTDELDRLQIFIKPLEKSPQLAAVGPQQLAAPRDDAALMSYRSPDGAWEISHDRRWYLHAQEDDSAVLRLIAGGQRVVQCNIASLPPSKPERPLSLADFQENVKEALGKSFGQFVEARQATTKAGHQMCRVVVRGEAFNVPVEWHYYLLGDRQGRQVALAFTLEAERAEKLEAADTLLVESLRFLDQKPPAATTAQAETRPATSGPAATKSAAQKPTANSPAATKAPAKTSGAKPTTIGAAPAASTKK